MIAYHIAGTTADKCEMNIIAERAAELAAQGWIVTEEPIMWAEKEYINGEVVDKPAPEPPQPYVPTLDETKVQRKEYVKQRRNQEESRSPFEYDASLFDYDPLSRERINSAVLGSTIAAISGVEPNTVVAEWRLWDNTTRDMTIADWMGFKQAEITRSSECFAIAAGLKNDIDTAPDIPAVNAIDWPAPAWPAGNDSIIYGNFAG